MNLDYAAESEFLIKKTCKSLKLQIFIVINMSIRLCKMHEVEVICAHAQWHKYHVFAQSRILLDTGTKIFSNSTGLP